MKKISKLFILTAVIFFPLVLGSCDNGNNTPPTTTDTETVKLDYDMSNVKFEDKVYFYDGKEHTLEITGSLPAGVSVTYTNNKLTEVGTLQVTASFKGDYVKYNKIPDMKATLAIVQGEYDMSNVRFEDKTVVYDGTAHSLGITGRLPEGVTVTYEDNENTNVGTYEVTAHFEGDAKNYKPIADMYATLTIVRADYNVSNIRFLDKTVTYDGTPQSLAITGTLPEGVTVTYEGNERTDVGIYEVTAHFEGDGLNYNPIPDMTAFLTVVKADYDMNAVKLLNKTVIYNGNPQSLEITGRLPAGVTVTYDGNANTDVGTYEVTAHFEGDGLNYNPIPDMKATLTIEKARYDMSKVRFIGRSFVYDGNEHRLEVTGELPKGVTVSYINNGLTDVGSVEVIAIFNGDAHNYEPIKELSATLAITKAEYELYDIKFENKTVTYNGNPQSLEITGALPAGVTVTYLNNNKTDAGTYDVIARFKGDGVNYNPIPDMKATLTIEKATYDMSGVKFEDQTLTYDAKYHAIRVEGDLPEGVSVIYDRGYVVMHGVYSYTASFRGDKNNYHPIPDMTATLTITRYPYSDGTYTIDGVYYSRVDNHLVVSGSKNDITGNVVLKDEVDGLKVTEINANTFASRDKIISITIPSNIAIIGQNAFLKCTNLNTVVFNEGVRTLDSGAFKECTNLKNVKLPNTVESVGDNAFNGCTNLINIEFGSETKTFGKSVLAGCTSLTKLTIPYLPGGFLESIFGGATPSFGAKFVPTTLKEVHLTNTTEIAAQAFYYCQKITKITLPENLQTIKNDAFMACIGLTEMVIPESVTMIGTGAFSDCLGLTNIVIKGNIKTISQRTFQRCTALKEITLPGTIAIIEDKAFFNCSALADVHYNGTATDWSAITIGTDNDALTSATLHTK